VTPHQVVPFSFDLSSLVRRSVASLYSHLVTRPTGRALRIGIESQIVELRCVCVSVLDFTHVVVLDYSCADEAVAKLMLRFLTPERTTDAYFIAKGLGEQHRDPLEAVLSRHGLALVAQLEEGGMTLLGCADGRERDAWSALESIRHADPALLASRIAEPESDTQQLLDALSSRRVVLRLDPAGRYYALSAFLPAGGGGAAAASSPPAP
jgi:hypothetical protein